MTDVSFLGLIQITDVFVSATCRFFICFLSDSIYKQKSIFFSAECCYHNELNC